MMAGSTTASNYELKPLSLPGATGVVTLDYFAYDRSTGKLWVPASNTGNVDVIDESSDAVSQVTGFKTGEVELRRRKVSAMALCTSEIAAIRPCASSTRIPSGGGSACRLLPPRRVLPLHPTASSM